MKPLNPPYGHYLNAAWGWLELGLPSEAAQELESIPACHQKHPAVLRLACQVAATLRRWRPCAEAARALTHMAPQDALGWTCLAHSLHQMGQTAEAHALLLQAAHLLGPCPSMALELCCYACCLGRWNESQDWLAKAFEWTAQPQEREYLKQRALAEPALAPLRDVIHHLA